MRAEESFAEWGPVARDSADQVIDGAQSPQAMLVDLTARSSSVSLPKPVASIANARGGGASRDRSSFPLFGYPLESDALTRGHFAEPPANKIASPASSRRIPDECRGGRAGRLAPPSAVFPY